MLVAAALSSFGRSPEYNYCTKALIRAACCITVAICHIHGKHGFIGGFSYPPLPFPVFCASMSQWAQALFIVIETVWSAVTI